MSKKKKATYTAYFEIDTLEDEWGDVLRELAKD